MQIDYAVLGAFTLLWLAIVPTPGPNTLLIVHLALTTGWRDVGMALVGNLFAITFYALSTLLGLSLLLAAAPSVRLAIYASGGRRTDLGRCSPAARRSGPAARRPGATLSPNPTGSGVRRPFVRGQAATIDLLNAQCPGFPVMRGLFLSFRAILTRQGGDAPPLDDAGARLADPAAATIRP